VTQTRPSSHQAVAVQGNRQFSEEENRSPDITARATAVPGANGHPIWLRVRRAWQLETFSVETQAPLPSSRPLEYCCEQQSKRVNPGSVTDEFGVRCSLIGRGGLSELAPVRQRREVFYAEEIHNLTTQVNRPWSN
jgi:hypothetical protein